MYTTNYQKRIIEFFKTNSNSSFSASNLIDYFKDINKATIYRKLTILEKEKIIHKGYNPNTKRYEYTYASNCYNHLHLICNKCGNITHLDCIKADNFIKHISTTHNFNVIEGETMLLGICKECEKNV